MYEFGYKGLFGDKLGISIDFFYNYRKNVFAAPFQASPFVLQPTLAEDLIESMLAGLNLDELAEMGVNTGDLTNLYNGFAQQLAFNSQTGMPNILGLIRSDQTSLDSPLPTLDAAYYNIKELDYFGLDFALKYYFRADLAAYGSISWLSQSYFEDVIVGSGESATTLDYSLNIPDTKFKFGVEYTPNWV